jgi:hypothetical protein
MYEMAEEVRVAQKVDSPFSQRDKAKIKAMITIDMHVSDLKKALNFYVELRFHLSTTTIPSRSRR